MTDPAPHLLTGRCFCGKVRYEVEDAFDYALHCHCSKCRRETGSAFKTLGGIASRHHKLTEGAGKLLTVGDPAGIHDIHCGACGSPLWSVLDQGEKLHVMYGTLTDTPTCRPSMHIFVGSKAEWFTITDDLPQHDTLPSPLVRRKIAC